MKSDEYYIRKCIELAERSLDNGEKPFGSLIVNLSGKIVVSSGDRTVKNKDVIAHAEIIAMRKAQKRFGNNLTGYSIYSNYEPCAMCSYMIRELKFSRVVFSLVSKDMGGYTKWPILQDTGLENLPLYFSKPPKIIPGLLRDEAVKTFERREKMHKG